MANISTEDLFSKAEELRDSKYALFAQIDANRKLLRNLSESGMLTAAERRKVEEIYPPRQRGENGDNDDEGNTE